jgi:mannitol/fructose-specific phosphotransferase system IIA component
MKDKKKTKTIPRQVRWDKLDNTAHLFPSIAGESMTNVYRISVTLKDEINKVLAGISAEQREKMMSDAIKNQPK